MEDTLYEGNVVVVNGEDKMAVSGEMSITEGKTRSSARLYGAKPSAFMRPVPCSVRRTRHDRC